MKVACDKCGKLVDENQAVKIDKPTFDMQIMGRPTSQSSIGINEFFKVCIKCYKTKTSRRKR